MFCGTTLLTIRTTRSNWRELRSSNLVHSALALQVEELTPAGSALTLLSARTKVGYCADIRKNRSPINSKSSCATTLKYLSAGSTVPVPVKLISHREMTLRNCIISLHQRGLKTIV